MRWCLILFQLFLLPMCARPMFAREGQLKKITYPFTSDLIDVVIPCIPKDLFTLELCIEGIKKNGKNIRRIIVLSKERLTDSAEWFSEEAFPFSKKEIALEIYGGDRRRAEEFLSSPRTRIGWIYQQLLKLYTPFVIPNLSPNVLILDSDVVFLRPIDFMTSSGEPYFIPATEYYPAYFKHAARLVPGFKKVNPSQSGISHHMLFQRTVLEDLFRIVEKRHKTECWKAMCRCVDLDEIYGSCMSEYEIYFNFIRLRSDQPRINPAKWSQIHSMQLLDSFRRTADVFVVIPQWLREVYGQK